MVFSTKHAHNGPLSESLEEWVDANGNGEKRAIMIRIAPTADHVSLAETLKEMKVELVRMERTTAVANLTRDQVRPVCNLTGVIDMDLPKRLYPRAGKRVVVSSLQTGSRRVHRSSKRKAGKGKKQTQGD